jgi:hypothetical protein
MNRSIRVMAGLAVASLLLVAAGPAPLDLGKAQKEVETAYAKAHPEVQEFVLHTARSFGPNAMWLNEDAYAALTDEERAAKVEYLAKLFADAEYGRHLCNALAEASAIKDAKLVPGLIKMAGYHKDDQDYDCRPKWVAISALARQESDDAVPLLVSMVDHGNQNCRMWARAALARIAHDDFKDDKQAWNKWWVDSGHPAIDAKLLEPWKAPPAK